MTIFDIINLIGGLALFLYGMTIMGSGLEKTAGSKLESILQKLTGSPLKSVALGAAITALIQSSSGTTVIVVGLVNSGIMKLSQAIGIIMGANIGTTVTGQIVRLSEMTGTGTLVQLLKPSAFAPILAFIGMILFVFIKSNAKRNIGQILLGFGLLFIGMSMMTGSVESLESSPLFAQLFTSLQNPILGLLAGTLVTVLVQSSSASVGILQALSVTGAVTWGSAIPIILGQNIGTCSTPIIASIGASKAAKRSAMVHLYFNVIGSLVFLGGIYTVKAIFDFDWWLNTIGMGEIANFHTIFNVGVTLLFLPFTKLLSKLAYLTIRENESDINNKISMPVLDKRLLHSPSVALSQAHLAIQTMAKYSKTNFETAVDLLERYDTEKFNLATQREDVIDKLEVVTGNYLVEITDRELTDEESKKINDYINYIIEFERIGDYSMDLINRCSEISDKKIKFSQAAMQELQIVGDAINEIIELSNKAFCNSDMDSAILVEPLEQTIDKMFHTLRNEHILRLQKGLCNIESGIIFLEMITTLERIADHCSNISSRVICASLNVEHTDLHGLRKKMHSGNFANYNENLRKYAKKYLSAIGNVKQKDSKKSKKDSADTNSKKDKKVKDKKAKKKK